MKAQTLIDSLNYRRISLPANQSLDFEVSLVSQNTHELIPNSVFIAISGFKTDGHDLVTQAINQGARLIVAQKPLQVKVPVVYVRDTRRAMATLSATFYGHPSQKLHLTGVTGTNGKTTVTHLLDAIYRYHHIKTGLVGTMYHKVDNQYLKAINTTPANHKLQKLFAQMVEAKVQAVSMEVSSVALVQGRTWEVDFNTAIFTNFSQDHLDYHQNMAEYAHAKSLLFSQLGNLQKGKTAIINQDDTLADFIITSTEAQILTYGIDKDADFQATKLHHHAQGTDFILQALGQSYAVYLPLVGTHNVYNALAAIAGAYVYGLDLKTIIAALKTVTGVKGRLQLVTGPHEINAFVDYAHTPAALANALQTLKPLTQSRIITVFGCGGNRDADKRPKMTQIAQKYSDLVILTTDNPRQENPADIILDMLRGLDDMTQVEIELDRRQAIRRAVALSHPGDVILLAGKGHKNYQIIGDTITNFDDVAELQAAFTCN